MKAQLLTSASLLVIYALISGCSFKSVGQIERSTQTLSAAAVIASNATPQDKAEKLAAIADTLFSAGAFTQTLDVTDAALTFDRANIRAGLIRSLAKPLVTLKGILLRIAPLAISDVHNFNYNESFLTSYLQSLGVDTSGSWSAADEAPAANFASLFTDAEFYNPIEFNKPADGGRASGLLARVNEHDAKFPGYAIKTEAQLQMVFDDAIENFDDLRTFTRAHKDADLTVTATALLNPDLIQRYASACVVKASAKLIYELECPPDETRTHIRLNRADFELIGDIASYYEFSFAIAAGYATPGLSEMASTHNYSRPMDDLVATPGFGKLRPQNKLKSLKALGLDLVGGLNWASSNQATLCQGPQGASELRPGFVFNNGFCLGRGYETLISVMTQALSGQSVELDVGGPRKVEFQPTAFFDSPLQDLTTLKPVFNEAGALTGVSDPTFGGVFPKRDAEYVLKTSAGESLP